jgi:hypothetical protein
MEAILNSEMKAAVDAAISAALARKAEAETKAAITAALQAAGLTEWGDSEPWPQRVEPPSHFDDSDENWSDPVILNAIDTSNIWRNSNGKVINSWLNVDRMEGWSLTVRFLDQPEHSAEVRFLPFKKQGRELCGMKPERVGSWEIDTWRTLVSGVNRQAPKHFRVQYKYERLER